MKTKLRVKEYKSTISVKSLRTEAEIYYPSPAKSQKGKGVINAWKALGKNAMPAVALITTDESPKSAAEIVRNFYKKVGSKDIFVRPCPESPNHGGKVGGFESQKFSTLAEILQRVNDAQKAFREQKLNADIVLMPYVQSTLSCVIAPKKYAIFGRGHDGVTAGTSDTVIIPLADSDTFVDRVSAFSSMQEDAYELEFVCSEENTNGFEFSQLRGHFVQVRRSGNHKEFASKPTQDSLPGFVPNGSMMVEKIYVVEDLEKVGELENMNNAPGLLVIQPGGSMLSHAAAHCRTKSIAFVIANTNDWIGKKITEIASGWITDNPDAQACAGMSVNDYWEDFKKGYDEPFHKWNVKLSVFFHDFLGRNVNAERGAYLAGRYVKWLQHAALTLCVGESRHTGSIHESDAILQKIRKGIVALTGNVFSQTSRDYLYKKLFDWNIPIDDAKKILQASEYIFSMSWSSGYGGKKWRNCAELAIAIIDGIQAGNVAAACEAANNLESSVHNNGRLFNKVNGWINSMDSGTSLMNIDAHILGGQSDERDILYSAYFALYPQKSNGAFVGSMQEYIDILNVETSSQKQAKLQKIHPKWAASAIMFTNEENK